MAYAFLYGSLHTFSCNLHFGTIPIPFLSDIFTRLNNQADFLNIRWPTSIHLNPFKNMRWVASVHLDTSKNISWEKGILVEKDTHNTGMKIHL